MQTVHIDALPLQPLRIPEGWTVDHNQFFEVRPGAALRLLGSATEDVWQLFGEDMLLLSHARHGYQLDLGWFPDSDPAGGFRITLVRGDAWDAPLARLETRDLDEAVAHIESLLRRGAIPS